MEAMTKVTRFPPLNVEGPVTTQTSAMSNELRIEVITNVIAGVLHDAFAMKTGLARTQLSHCQPAVRQVYEGLARLAVLPLLDDDAVKLAEGQAIEHAITMLDDYDAADEPSFRRRERLVNVLRSALATYTAKLMAVPR